MGPEVGVDFVYDYLAIMYNASTHVMPLKLTRHVYQYVADGVCRMNVESHA